MDPVPPAPAPPSGSRDLRPGPASPHSRDPDRAVSFLPTPYPLPPTPTPHPGRGGRSFAPQKPQPPGLPRPPPSFLPQPGRGGRAPGLRGGQARGRAYGAYLGPGLAFSPEPTLPTARREVDLGLGRGQQGAGDLPDDLVFSALPT